nr:helix-turn-helix transcriptional regulator [uncultured Prevotella sp.]
MKDRIRQIMEGSHMNQQTFAQFIGMSSASLSSIFTGRTKPTINIVEAIKNKIPSISTDWLMFGFGDMYITKDKTDETAQNDTHSSTESQLIDFGSTSQATPPSLFDQAAFKESASTAQQSQKIIVKEIDKKVRQITEIRIFYDDQTWETFVPKK